MKKPERTNEEDFKLENEVEKARNRDAVMTLVFERHFEPGAKEVSFTLDDIREAIAEVQRESPSYKDLNVYDVRYQYTSGRQSLPEAIDRSGSLQKPRRQFGGMPPLR